MAQVTNPNIPTDLQAAYSDLVSLHDLGSSKPARAQIKPSVRGPATKVAPSPELAALAKDAAAWLTAAWYGDRTVAEQSVFYAERYNAIIEGAWQEPYWRILDMTSDRTALAEPAIYPYRPATWPPYADQQHRPSECYYNHYTSEYATPVYQSLGQYKSPGWHGAIVAERFEDTWMATRIQRFAIPARQQGNTRRPIALRVSIQIEATATIRGWVGWFTPITRASVQSAGWDPVQHGKPQPYYKPSWEFRESLPGDQPGGWTHDELASVQRYGSWKVLGKQRTTGSIIVVEVATSPAMGRYFVGNDTVTVTHDEVITVYWPLGPGEM